MYKEIKTIYSFLFFLVFTSISFPTIAQNGGGGTVPPTRHRIGDSGDPGRIIISNWDDKMNAAGCILVEEDFIVNIYYRINFMTKDLGSFPDLYFRPVIDGVQYPVHGPITSADVYEFEANGLSLFQTEIQVDFNVEPICANSAGSQGVNGVPFNYAVEFLTDNPQGSFGTNPSFIPYPINAYIGTLFHPETFDKYEGALSHIFENDKELCCPSFARVSAPSNNSHELNAAIEIQESFNLDGDYNTIDNSINEINKSIKSTNSLGKISFYPNPFNEELSVTFNQNEYTSQEIRIFNTAGKLVYSRQVSKIDFVNQSVSISLQDLPNGVYWCLIGEAAPAKIIKINP